MSICIGITQVQDRVQGFCMCVYFIRHGDQGME